MGSADARMVQVSRFCGSTCGYRTTRCRFKKCSPRARSGGATWLWVTWTVNRSGPSEFLVAEEACAVSRGRLGERSEGWARRPYLEATERDRIFDYHSCIGGPLAAQIENEPGDRWRRATA